MAKEKRRNTNSRGGGKASSTSRDYSGRTKNQNQKDNSPTGEYIEGEGYDTYFKRFKDWVGNELYTEPGSEEHLAQQGSTTGQFTPEGHYKSRGKDPIEDELFSWQQTMDRSGGDPSGKTWDNKDLQERFGDKEADMNFAGQRFYDNSGDKGASSDAAMLKAASGPPSQDMINEINKIIDSVETRRRMEAGDYEGMGAKEFSEAVQEGGVPDPHTPMVDAWGAGSAEDQETFSPPTEAARDMRKQTGFRINPDWDVASKMQAVEANRQYGHIDDATADEMNKGIIEEMGAEADKATARMQSETDRYVADTRADWRKDIAKWETGADIASARAENSGEGPAGGPLEDMTADDVKELTDMGIDTLRRNMDPEEFNQLSEQEKRRRGFQEVMKVWNMAQRRTPGGGGGSSGQSGSEMDASKVNPEYADIMNAFKSMQS